MLTTPTGIPVARCSTCGRTHPITRRHCARCTAPSMFVDRETGVCLRCRDGREVSALEHYLETREADMRPDALEGPTHPWFPFISSTTSDALYDVVDGTWACGRPTSCVKLLGHGGACKPASDVDWHHHPRAWQPREVWERMSWLEAVAS